MGVLKRSAMGVLKRSAMGLPSLVLRHQVLHVELVRVLALALQCSAHKLEPIRLFAYRRCCGGAREHSRPLVLSCLPRRQSALPSAAKPGTATGVPLEHTVQPSACPVRTASRSHYG